MKVASLQPSVAVSKGKVSFTTMIHGCEGLTVAKKPI